MRGENGQNGDDEENGDGERAIAHESYDFKDADAFDSPSTSPETSLSSTGRDSAIYRTDKYGE